MSVSNEVNIDVLNEVYALSAFHGLRAADPDDQWNDQMTDETEADLPNTETHGHADGTHHLDHETEGHTKFNPALEAMQRAMGTASATGGSTEVSHPSSTNVIATNGTEKNHRQSKLQEGHLDHQSMTGSDYLATPLNKSTDDLTHSPG